MTQPDLRIEKGNDVGGKTTLDVPWTWTLAAANVGSSSVTFFSGLTILIDALPPEGISYGAPTISNVQKVTGADRIACEIAANVLRCVARGGDVAIGVGGSFTVSFIADPKRTGTYASPRADGVCAIDPSDFFSELRSSNNSCKDTVIVGGIVTGTESKDRDKPDEQRLTETQRHQRDHTNASGQDDYRTEGNVLEVRCDASSPPEYDVTFPTHAPYVVIATRDGNQQLRLLKGSRSQCSSVQVGDYAEAEGEKQHELLFDAHDLETSRRR